MLLSRYLPVTVIILAIAALLRIWQVDRIPSGINGDELAYNFAAESVLSNGTDVSGTWHIGDAFTFRYPPGDNQAELPYVLSLIGHVFSRDPLVAARIVNAVLGTALVVSIGLLGARLFSPGTGMIAMALMAVNPWFVYESRTGYETVPAVFFYITSLYFLTGKTRRDVITGFILAIAGFYSYIGTKLLFIPVLLMGSAYTLIVKGETRRIREYAAVTIMGILFVAWFWLRIRTGSQAARLGELLLPWSPDIERMVDAARKTTIANPLSALAVNKLTVYCGIVLTKMFKQLSPDFLFVLGDDFFSVWKHGFLYPLDAVFITIGSYAAWKRHAKLAAVLTASILVFSLPHAVHSADLGNFSIHTTMVFPVLLIISAYGLHTLLQGTPGRFRWAAVSVILALYLASAGSFLHTYFFQLPLKDTFDVQTRTLSRYIGMSGRPVTVYSPKPVDLARKYVYYAGLLTGPSYARTASALRNKTYSFGSVTFSGCPDGSATRSAATGTVAVYDAGCGMGSREPHVRIQRLTDGGTAYDILGDGTCSPYGLKPYPANIRLSDLAIEQLPPQRFCESFVGMIR